MPKPAMGEISPGPDNHASIGLLRKRNGHSIYGLRALSILPVADRPLATSLSGRCICFGLVAWDLLS
jgi:hypothetical protein